MDEINSNANYNTKLPKSNNNTTANKTEHTANYIHSSSWPTRTACRRTKNNTSNKNNIIHGTNTVNTYIYKQ